MDIICNLTGAYGNKPNCPTKPGAPKAFLLSNAPMTYQRSQLTANGIKELVESGAIVAILKGFDDYTANNTDAQAQEYAGSGKRVITANQLIGGNLVFAGDPCMAKVANRFEGQQLHLLVITANGYVGRDTNSSETIATFPIIFNSTSIDSPLFVNTGDNNVTIQYSLGDAQALVRRMLFVPSQIEWDMLAGKDVVKFNDVTKTSAKVVTDCGGFPYLNIGNADLEIKVNGVVAPASLTSIADGVVNYTITPTPISGDVLELKLVGNVCESDWQRTEIV